MRRVQEADLVLYDALIDADALRGLTKAPVLLCRQARGSGQRQAGDDSRLMIRAARQGKRVVRLKGGDPFVFGRGAEEALALAGAGIPCEVVPGVTTAVAAPELAGIPVTHRGVVVGVPGGGRARRRCARCRAGGGAAEQPDAGGDDGAGGPRRDVAHGCWRMAGRRIRRRRLCAALDAGCVDVDGPLDRMSAMARAAGGAPGVLVVGEVVQVREALAAATAVGDSAGQTR